MSREFIPKVQEKSVFSAVLIIKGHAFRFLAFTCGCAGNVYLLRVADTLVIIFAIYCFTFNVDLGGRASHRASGTFLPALLKAFAASVLTLFCILSSHQNISFAAVHRVIIHAVLSRTN